MIHSFYSEFGVLEEEIEEKSDLWATHGFVSLPIHNHHKPWKGLAPFTYAVKLRKIWVQWLFLVFGSNQRWHTILLPIKIDEKSPPMSWPCHHGALSTIIFELTLSLFWLSWPWICLLWESLTHENSFGLKEFRQLPSFNDVPSGVQNGSFGTKNGRLAYMPM